jgi:Spy/CpxP family protein refolding chaperone
LRETLRDDTTRGKEIVAMTIKKLTRTVTALAVAGMFIAGGTAFAQEETGRRGMRGPGMRGPRGGDDFMHFRMLRQLELTEDQRTALRNLRETHFQQTEVEREALMEARKAFKEAVEVGDETAIRDAANLMAGAEADMAIARIGFRDEFLQVLTTEQQQKMKELQADMEAFRKERLERRKTRQEEGPPK